MKRILTCKAMAIALVALLPARHAHASCGSAFCTLMTDRYAQGTGEPQLGWSADFRLESVNLTQLRSGTRNLDASQVSGEEAIERHTRNLNLITALAYGVDDDWSIVARLPLLHRDHLHDLVDDATGLPATPEQWRFTRLGDASVVARRQFAADGTSAWALYAGLKLPTGSTSVVNADGTRAERALQPGTGTTDLVLGWAARRAVGPRDALIAQAGISQALNSAEDYKPGTRIDLSAGCSHAFAHDLGAVLQLNLRQRAHDSGAQAEPENSGSTTLDLSPGLTLAIGPASTAYVYVQLPLFQRVSGIQLVPRYALAMGFTTDF